MANKRVRKLTAAQIVTKSYLLKKAVKMSRYGSLININPSGFFHPLFTPLLLCSHPILCLGTEKKAGKRKINLNQVENFLFFPLQNLSALYDLIVGD